MHSRYATPTSAIVLRKVRGAGAALWRFGSSAPPFSAPSLMGVLGALCAILFFPLLVLGLIALAFVGDAGSSGLALAATPVITAKEIRDEIMDAFTVFRDRYQATIDNMKAQLDAVERLAARPRIDGGEPSRAGRPEAREAFLAFLRGASPAVMHEFAPQNAIQNAMHTGSNPDGGYLIPQEISKEIEKHELSFSPLRRLARVREVKSDRPEFLLNVGGAATGWVGELATRPDDTQTADVAVVTPPMGEIYATPQATQRMVDDGVGLEEFIVSTTAEEFAEQEGAAFATGDGIMKPRGFLTYPTSEQADSARPNGTVQFTKSGNASGFAATNPGDPLIDLVHSLRAPYRQGASWLMNSKTLASVRKFKDGQGNYLLRPSYEPGAPELLLGYPVSEDENMPDAAANAFPIAFANWMRAYLIADHVTGVRMLRDNLTTKGYVKFYTTKRVGGSLFNSQALKLFKIAA